MGLKRGPAWLRNGLLIGVDEKAHTDGDLAVFLPSANVLVMGDLFTHHSYPVIDESSGGSSRGMLEAIDRLLPMIDRDAVVVPGHGAATNRAGRSRQEPCSYRARHTSPNENTST